MQGKEAGFHRGGWTRFSVDITKHLKKNGENVLAVYVYDPTDSDDIVIPGEDNDIREGTRSLVVQLASRPCAPSTSSTLLVLESGSASLSNPCPRPTSLTLISVVTCTESVSGA